MDRWSAPERIRPCPRSVGSSVRSSRLKPCRSDDVECPTGLTVDGAGERIAWVQPELGEDGLSGDLAVQGVDDVEPSSVVPLGLLPDGIDLSTVELSGPWRS